MRVLVIYSHPVPESFCAALRDTVMAALGEAGHETRLLDLYEPAGDNAAQLRATVDIARRRLAEIRLQHEELLDIIEDLEARVRDERPAGEHRPTPDRRVVRDAPGDPPGRDHRGRAARARPSTSRPDWPTVTTAPWAATSTPPRPRSP